MSFENVPIELRLYNNWILWRHEEIDGKLTKIPYQLSGYKADTTNPSHWTSFDTVVNYKTKLNGHSGFDGIGFVFSDFDPFFGIDLDYTEDQKYFERQLKIYNNFNSYSEYSPSGKGIHIIGIGKIPQGRKRDKIEVYSSGRFFTVTGQVYNPAPIAHRQELLDILWAEMGAPPVTYRVQNKPEIIDDREVMKRATNAINGEKFTSLFMGQWQDRYPSQSEADFALIDIIAFYTQNIEQIERIWHLSQLSKRDKGKRKDYIRNMIQRSFDKQLPEVDISGLQAQFEAAGRQQEGPTPGNKADPSVPLRTGERISAQAQPGSGAAGEAISSAAAANLLASAIAVKIDPPPTWPPGLLGEIASYIYKASPYPCYEIALAGAIGLMAGICGRAYNISNTGVNLYLIFLAVTGVGKEAASSGISKIMGKIKKSIPQAETFIGPSDIRSEQALVKYLENNKSFVSIYSEFGLKLKQMNENNSANDMGLRSILLKLFNKSGYNDELGKIIYSDQQKNTKDLKAPAFTLLGESTPEEYYSAIDENLIADGFLNRFITLEYKGKRPIRNQNQLVDVPYDLEYKLCNLISTCLSRNLDTPPINVEITDDARKLFDSLEGILTDLINQNSSELLRKLWVRATVKALKLAAIPAIGLNHIRPVVDFDCAKWACDIIIQDTNNIAEHFELGKVGERSLTTYSSDINQLNDMIKVIKKWVKREEVPPRADDKMLAANVYTFSSLQIRLASVASYRNDKLGSSNAFKKAIQTLLDAGDIQEIPTMQVSEKFGKRAKSFIVTDYDRFLTAH